MRAPQTAVLLRIYTEEGKMNNHRPLYEDIVMKARAAKLAGATVLRGPMGYGLHAVIHTAKILDLSAKLPLVIEIVDAEDKIRDFLVAHGVTPANAPADPKAAIIRVICVRQ